MMFLPPPPPRNPYPGEDLAAYGGELRRYQDVSDQAFESYMRSLVMVTVGIFVFGVCAVALLAFMIATR